jgi:hypothetical protein
MNARRLFELLAVPVLFIGVSALTAGAQGLAPPSNAPLAPEIDGGSLSGAVAMLVCGALLFTVKGRMRAPQAVRAGGK